MATDLPVIRIPITGVPAKCPHCGIAAAFPLTVCGNRVQISCPACHQGIAQVALTSQEGG